MDAGATIDEIIEIYVRDETMALRAGYLKKQGRRRNLFAEDSFNTPGKLPDLSFGRGKEY